MQVKFVEAKRGEWHYDDLTDGKIYTVLDTMDWHDGTKRYVIEDDYDEKLNREQGRESESPYEIGIFEVV